MLNKLLRVCRICVLLAQKWEGFSNIILGLATIATKIGHKGGISSDRPPTLPPIFGKNYVDTFWSPGAKPLAGAERQKERSSKERTTKLVGTGRGS